MKAQLEQISMREMIRGFIEINQQVLDTPNISSGQRDNLAKLENELKCLYYQKDETKIQSQLLDIFNGLN